MQFQDLMMLSGDLKKNDKKLNKNTNIYKNIHTKLYLGEIEIIIIPYPRFTINITKTTLIVQLNKFILS